MRRAAAIAMMIPGLLGAQIRLEDGAAAAGLSFELKNGAAGRFHLVELMPGGVAAFDANGDGCMDLYFSNGATLPSLAKQGPAFSNRLFLNDCKAHFQDVTEKAGVGGEGYAMAVAAADYDNDGDTDLFVSGVYRNTLYRNKGDGTFEDVTAKAGLTNQGDWSIAAGWIDMDQDGHLDLVVSNYVVWNAAKEPACGTSAVRVYCHPDRYSPRPHQLFHNNGDGTFRDISAMAGLSAHPGKGMGIAFGDYDQDGRPDVFIANDSIRNFLFHNEGGNRLTEVGLEMGAALSESGRPMAAMGADFRDFDNDGRPDLAVTGMVNDGFLLLRNLGAPRFFEDVSAQSGVAAVTRSLTGWGMGMVDLDNDGWRDLFFANAHFPQLGRLLGTASPLGCQVLRNTSTGRFVDVTATTGDAAKKPLFHRGTAFADFDGDGRLDVAVSALDAPAQLLLNRTVKPGNWLAVRLKGRKSNRDGIGAQVTLQFADGKKLSAMVSTTVGYASSSEPLARFGLGVRTRIARLSIDWPSGVKQALTPEGINRVLAVTEPE